MDIDVENSAPTTERSLPPPTPPDSSMPSPTPTVPPPPPSNPTLPTSSVTERQILQPVLPSRRASTDARPKSETLETDTINAYLSLELAIFVKERQRRERPRMYA